MSQDKSNEMLGDVDSEQKKIADSMNTTETDTKNTTSNTDKVQ